METWERKWVEVKRAKWEGRLKRRKRKQKKAFRPELVSCPSPHSHHISVLAARFYKLSRDTERGQNLEIWHSFTFLLVCASRALFFFLKNREQDGISRGQRETEQESFKQQNPWLSVPQGSVWLPCGCNVFVRPSPLITIMSLERSMRAGFVWVHVWLERCEWECL